ncbi:hypothetical protein SAMN05421837_102195 [Amycolatopsis pretoriensis]|uniref:Phage integrase family protein n=1 Tax=Amycolatopsis pretoriensis TaxID=218821 RepID=A0A1H5QDI3_9PSEU|nr:hypothetical protein [Amycolatopsis pretoriensis]SEF23468.1 hypothetical protein SAMN05421837_102195 [Amycolatopsis pretoriensis]
MALPPGIAVLYEELMDSHREPFVLFTPEGHPWRRSNFRIRFWRPAWDGIDLDEAGAGERRPPILPTSTFHEGRHTHSTWLTEDGIPEVARCAQLGQKMKGVARSSITWASAVVSRIDARADRLHVCRGRSGR